MYLRRSPLIRRLPSPEYFRSLIWRRCVSRRLALLAAWTEGSSRLSLASLTLKMRILPELKPHAKNVPVGRDG
jgi:hypothetical protein